mgnify:CR=1 FL=1
MANENLENRFERIKRTALNGVILLSTFMPYGCSHNFYSLNEDTKQTTTLPPQPWTGAKKDGDSSS